MKRERERERERERKKEREQCKRGLKLTRKRDLEKIFLEIGYHQTVDLPT